MGMPATSSEPETSAGEATAIGMIWISAPMPSAVKNPLLAVVKMFHSGAVRAAML
jgi:hypothetical protein